MRTIPVTINNDHTKVVGHLQLDDNISDEEVVNCTPSWGYFPSDKKLMEMVLSPKPKTVPLSVELEGVHQVIGSAVVRDEENGISVTATISEDAPESIKKAFGFSGPFSIQDEDVQFKNWLSLWIEGNLPFGVYEATGIVNKFYRDLVAAQYKITKEDKPKVKIENDPPGLFSQHLDTIGKDLAAACQITRDQAQDVAIRSGLNVNTVIDLLMKGWTYRLEVDQPDKWVKEF